MSIFKKLCAEFLGTMVLVVFGCGIAVVTLGQVNALDVLSVALAFGLALIAMAYSIGNVSGCHINPAVSLAMLLTKRMSFKDFIGYVCAQFLGGIAGGGVLALLYKDGAFGANGYGLGVSMIDAGLGAALVMEAILTFVFVFLILYITSQEKYSNISGMVIGLTLTLVHLFGIPFTGTSVNPARSFGPALFAAICGDTTYLSQVWVFIVAPLVGAALAALVYAFFNCKKCGCECKD